MIPATRISGRVSGALTSPTPRSLLAVDCGSIFTKVALLGLVDGRHRLLGVSQTPTTSKPPHVDVMQGIRTAIADLERICARPLVREGRVLTPEREDGEGVDAVGVVVSVGGPLRLLTAGPGREALAALVHRALGGLFAAFEPLPADATPPTEAGSRPEWDQLVARLRALHPHAVLVVGSALEGQRGRPDIAETGHVLASLLDAARGPASPAGAPELPVVFTGLHEDGALLQGALARRAQVVPVEPLAPATAAPLGQAVAALYEHRVLRTIPGYDGVRALANNVSPTAYTTSLARMIQSLGQHDQMNVVGVDVGASSTTLVGATAQGDVLPAVQAEAGVGPGLGVILRASGAANVLRWLTEPIEEAELREYVIGRMLRPRLVPATARELEIEQAFAREAIQLALRAPGSSLATIHPLDVILGTGGVLAHAPQPAQAALVLLDALQPRGITSLVLDTAQIAGTLGTLAGIAPTASAEVAEGDAVAAQLGSVVSAFGTAAPGEPAVRVALEYGDGRRHVTDVVQGSLVRLPLQPGERALLSLYPAPTVNIGLGPGQQARASDPLEGGLLGVIVDARGRPLALPSQDQERCARIREWRQALGINA